MVQPYFALAFPRLFWNIRKLFSDTHCSHSTLIWMPTNLSPNSVCLLFDSKPSGPIYKRLTCDWRRVKSKEIIGFHGIKTCDKPDTFWTYIWHGSECIIMWIMPQLLSQNTLLLSVLIVTLFARNVVNTCKNLWESVLTSQPVSMSRQYTGLYAKYLWLPMRNL